MKFKSLKPFSVVATVEVADALPEKGVPAPPSDFHAGEAVKAPKVLAVQIEGAPEAVQCLRGEAKSLGDKLGAYAPAVAPVADGLEFAARWSLEERRAEAWLAYAQAQARKAWTHALAGMDALHASLVPATQHDATLRERMEPALKVLAARSDLARASFKRRAMGAKAKAKAKKAEPPAPKETPSIA